MLKSLLLMSLISLPVVAHAAPGRVLEDARTRKLERTEVQKPESKRKLEEVEEKSYLLKRSPENTLPQPAKTRVPLQREGARGPDAGRDAYRPRP